MLFRSPMSVSEFARVQTTFVYPTSKHKRPPVPTEIPLHGYDLLSWPLQIKNHRFFNPPETLEFDDIIKKLQTSLAEALELYPPVAGQVRTNERGDMVIATRVDSGTPFLVERRETPFIADFEGLAPRSEVLLPIGSQVLAVKVTQFACGTIAVAVSIHHQVTDLRGYLDFLEVWSSLVRGETPAYSTLPRDFSHTPGRFLPPLSEEQDAHSAPPGYKALPLSSADGGGGSPFSPARITRWRFTPTQMSKLKKDMTASFSSPAQWISSGDAVAALAASSITRARNAANLPRLQCFGGGSSTDSLYDLIAMAADGRSRAPDGAMLNRQYFGNFNALPIISVSRTDLESPSLEGCARVALHLRQGLQEQLSPQALAHKTAFFEDPKHKHPEGRVAWNSDVTMTNWSGFDLEGSEFGLGWGSPFLTTDGSVGSAYPPGYVLFQRDGGTKGLLAMITVETEALAGLETDMFLQEYGTLIS